MQDQRYREENRMEVQTKIEPYDGGFRVLTTTPSAGSWWGVGVTFPTEAGAERVADVIREEAAR